MFVIYARNVNDAYYHGLQHLINEGEHQPSRAGNVLVLPYPLTTCYSHPMERVLFDEKRDANPFFHLFESLWMLAGRNDATWLDKFVSDFSSRFAESNGTQHGAYGHRWRYHFKSLNQLNKLVSILRENPNDRRAVLTMWDPVSDLGVDRRDIPCNTNAYLRIRTKAGSKPELDITVCCRSNDAIFGCYGANAVHFSILQEYLASMLGIGVGKYYQISNNFHAYVDVLEKHQPDFSKEGKERYDHPYETIQTMPMITNAGAFGGDLANFFAWTVEVDHSGRIAPWLYSNSWFNNTAEPLYTANWCWKQRRREEALAIVNNPSWDMAPDWRIAAQRWMRRRMDKDKAVEQGANSRQIGGDHYKTGYEHWDLVLKTGMGYLEGNATKYVSRWRKKGGSGDLMKALHYVDKLLEANPQRVLSVPAITIVQEVSAFAVANKLDEAERDVCLLIASWTLPANLQDAKLRIELLLTEPKPVPLEDSNKHAERA